MQNRILIIDDDEEICKFFQRILREEGYEIFTATNGKSGIVLFRKLEGIKLVFLDIKMPKVDGITTLKRIKKISKDIPVVMMTGYGDLNTVKSAMKFGAIEYVTKPFNINSIKSIINEVLKK